MQNAAAGTKRHKLTHSPGEGAMNDFKNIAAKALAAAFALNTYPHPIIGHNALHALAGDVDIRLFGVIGDKKSKTVRVTCDDSYGFREGSLHLFLEEYPILRAW